MRLSRLTKAVATAGAGLLLLAPAAHATEAPATEVGRVCLNGMPPPAGIDQWCVVVAEGNVIVGFETNRYGSPGHEDSSYVYVCQKPSPEFIGVCAHIPR